MGKKSKQKKQRNQQQRQKAVAQGQTVSITPTHLSTNAQAPSQNVTSSRPVGLEIGEQYIRRDITRILILLAIVAVVLVVLVILNSHGTLLVHDGQTLAHFAELQ